MRFTLYMLLMFLSLNIYPQENLAMGQNLNDYLQQHPPIYKTIGPRIFNFPEGVIDFYKYKPQTDDTDIKILMILDKYPIGVLQSEKGKSLLYYDLTGDATIDTEVSVMEVPFWVVASNTDAKFKTSNNNIKYRFKRKEITECPRC